MPRYANPRFTLWGGARPMPHVHGLVSRFSQGESGYHRTYYHAPTEPQLARADLRSNIGLDEDHTITKTVCLKAQHGYILDIQRTFILRPDFQTHRIRRLLFLSA